MCLNTIRALPGWAIPKANEKKVIRLVRNYRILKSAIDKASDTNLGGLMAGKKKKI